MGRGSFGNVYLLVHSQDGPPPDVNKYALKVIDEHGARKGDREEARKELRIMRGLYHPHIVDLIDAFELQHEIHMVLELCEGGDLRSHLDHLRKRRGRERRPTAGVEESLVISWTKQLASALTYLHHKKILHRDLKPQNIFLKDKYNLKVGDLGIARQLRFTLEMAATHIGTPLYISPEIYQGTPYSYKADVWSLGCCVYEMMALQCAFQAASRYEVMWKVVSKQLGPVPQCYSSDLRSLTVSMLQKDPESRPSAAHVQAAVHSMLQQQERPPWEKRSPRNSPPARPADASTLQTWRHDMASALVKFLSQKHAIHSAGLAELSLQLSKGSIHGTDDMSVTLSQTEDSVASGRRVSTSSTEHRYSSESDCDNDLTVTLQSSSKTISSACTENGASERNDISSSQKTQITRGMSRRSAFKVKHGQSPNVKRKKSKDSVSDDTERMKDNEGDDGGSSSHDCSQQNSDLDLSLGEDVDDSDVLDTTKSSMHPVDRQHSHEYRQIEKMLPTVNPRPLPLPGRNAKSDYEPSLPNNPSGNQLRNASPDSVATDAKLEHVYYPLPRADQKDAHAAYAEEVARWARAHLFAPDHTDSTPSEIGKLDDASPVKDGSERKISDADLGSVGGDEQEMVTEERPKRKKKNFLKERKNRQQAAEAAKEAETTSEAGRAEKAQDKMAVDAQDEGVTLFTRGQRVTFSTTRDPSPGGEEPETKSERLSVRRVKLVRELGETTFQAAVSATILLRNRPALLELQLKELLGRENYKKHSADIVKYASEQDGAV